MTNLTNSVAKRLEATMPCKKCGGVMRRGVALEQTFTGTPDFAGGEVVAMSLGGSGRLVACLKCSLCGFSTR